MATIVVGPLAGPALIQAQAAFSSAAGQLGPSLANTGWSGVDPLIDYAFAVSIAGAGLFDELDGYVNSVDLSAVSVDYDSVKQRGMLRNFAQGASSPQISVGFNEDSIGTILAWYNQVQQAAYDHVGGTVGLPIDYQMDITASILTPSGPALQLVYHNCAAVSLATYKMGTGGATAIRPAVTFKCDYPELIGQGIASGLPTLLSSGGPVGFGGT